MTVMKADDPGWKQAEEISTQVIDFLRVAIGIEIQYAKYLES